MTSELTLDHWREAMAHLRHLSAEVNRTFYFWVGCDVFLIVVLVSIPGVSFLTRGRSTWAAGLLSATGFFLTLAGRYLLRRARIYYLQMLAKKTLIEDALGFYERLFPKAGKTDLAFPWRLAPEVVSSIQNSFDGWVSSSIRSRGTMARIQFLCLELFLCLYFLLFLCTLAFQFHQL